MANEIDPRQPSLFTDPPASPAKKLIDTLKPRQPIHPLVLQLIKEGALDFLDATKLRPGQKEVKVAKKRFGAKPAFWKKAKR